MYAVVITEPGEPDVLRWLEVPDPVPGPGDVVIEIAASVIDRKLPMSQAAQAHRALADSEPIGKILLVPE
jgi:NADPH:quinone reductase-like Zn-dependent oxidoreductase